MKSKKKRQATKKETKPEEKLPRWENITIVFTLLLLFLLWITSFFPERRLWGINHWAYFPLWLRTLVIAVAFFIFIPQVNRRLQIFFNQTVIPVFRYLTERQKYSGYVLMVITSLVVFYLFRTKIPLLGDGFQILGNINAGTLSVNWSQPLAIWIYLSLFDLLNPIFHTDGAAVYALVSYLSGMIYVIFALRTAILLGKSSSSRLFVFLILTLMGSIQLFFGYAEHYPLLCSGILIYLFYSLKYLQGETKILIPILIFFILIPLHFFSLYLFPSILFLFLFGGEEKSLRDIFKRRKTQIAILFLLLLLVGIVLYVRQHSWFVFRYLVPFFKGSYTGPNYTLLSPSHLLDFLNEQFLISPVALVLFLVFLISKPKLLGTENRVFQFLLIVSGAQLLVNFLINPGLGAPRDWDLFASVGLGYTLLALYLFSWTSPNPKVSYLKLNLVIVALLFTLPWILINANPDRSVARFRNLLDLDPKKSRNGHFILAGYFDRVGETEEVDRENRMIKQKFPEVELANQGFSLLLKDDFDQAYQRFTRAIQISPDFAEAHAGLGWYYFKTGNLQQSELELEKALQLKPDFKLAYVDLGDVYMQKGEFKKAKKFYTRAIKLGVDDEDMWNNLGILYAQLGDLDKAVSFYQKAIAKNKNFAESHYGLAFIYYKHGRLEQSLRQVNLLLQIDPNFALGYYQLGLTCEGLGRKKEAILAYQRYLEMQPNDPIADHIKKLIEKLRADGK